MRYFLIYSLLIFISCKSEVNSSATNLIQTSFMLRRTIKKLEKSNYKTKELNKKIQKQLDEYESPYSKEEIRIGDSIKKVYDLDF